MTRRLGTALRLLIGIGAMVWLIAGIDAGEAWNTLQRASAAWLVVAMLAQIGSKACWLYRWKELLNSVGQSRPTGELAKLVLLGLFFNNFLPSSVGGDVARGIGLAGLGVPKATAAASVLADRMVGLFSMAIVAVLGAAAGLFLQPAQGPWLPATILALVLAAGTALFSRPAVIAALSRIPAFTAQKGLGRKVGRLLESAQFLAEREAAMRRAIVLSLGLSVFSTIYHWAIGQATGIAVPFTAYCVLVPAVMLFSSLPITLNGLGIREVSFVGLLAAQGVPRADATVFALLAFLGTQVFSIAGGVLFLAEVRGRWSMRKRALP
ncbi:MAG TPA: lysylphosphatidylglycerol synthase transmembrane domain-containing protein [bacterium]|nr:lysylphosphatidylglycerol synthase transmembrane domain-containing protein [bacterium]